MKLIATIIRRDVNKADNVFHVRLADKDRRYFGHEDIITRNIGPRPWSEMFWTDETGHVNLVYAK